MIKKKIFCLWAAALILSGCAGVFQGKEKETEPDFVLTYAENQAEDYPTTQGADKFAELGAWRAIRSCEKEFKLTIAVAANKAVFIQLKFIRLVIHFDIRCKHLGKSNTTCSTP